MTAGVVVRPAVPGDLPAAYALRHEVFVVGQAVPEELERDELDDTCDHVVALRAGTVVDTGRLVDRGDGTGVIGRVAVARQVRGAGVGAAVLAALEDRAAARGLREVELHAQVQVLPFYDRAGYEPFGDTYLEAGIVHRSMRKVLPG